MTLLHLLAILTLLHFTAPVAPQLLSLKPSQIETSLTSTTIVHSSATSSTKGTASMIKREDLVVDYDYSPLAERAKRATTDTSSTCLTSAPPQSSPSSRSGWKILGTVIISIPIFTECPISKTTSTTTTISASSISSTVTKASTTPSSSSTSTNRTSSSSTSTRSAIGPTSSAADSFSCNATAYYIETKNSDPEFYNIVLKTGVTTVVNTRLGGGAYTNVNGMGFNPLDNFLYAIAQISGTEYAVIRISVSGVVTQILEFTASSEPGSVGDIDTDGQFWFSGGGTTWYQVDLAPGSSTHGKMVNNGTSTLTGFTVYDWSYLPGQGNYLWAVSASDGSNPHLALLRWSTISHTWSTYESYTGVSAPHPFIASWGSNNGTIWGYASTSGEITQIDLGKTPYVVSTGLTGITNGDGARCGLTS